MTLARSRFSAVPLLLQAVACGYRDLPPPSAPPRTFPHVVLPAEPPAAGKSRVVIDANGERAIVTEVKAWRSSRGWVEGTSSTLLAVTEEEEPLCIAPCTVALSRGMHVLRFKSVAGARSSKVAVEVDERSLVLRHAMGEVEKGSDGALFTGLMLAVLGGSAVMVGGLLFAPSYSGNSTEEERHQTGTALMLGGGVAIALSVPIFLLARGTRQPGATTVFAF